MPIARNMHHQDRWSLEHIQDGAARTKLRMVALERETATHPELVAAAVLEAPASDWPGAL